jgi:serine phosphatase RsbU (regulator of sigma subunit)
VKVRTQLLIAFLVLAVLPLSGIVLYSYLSSQQAFRRAVEAEGQVLAEETGKRLGAARAELEKRLQGLASLPTRSLVPGVGAYGETIGVYADLMVRMGEATDLLEFIEYTPATAEVAAEPFLIFPSQTLAKAIGKLQKKARQLEASGLPRDYIDETIRQAIWERRKLGKAELAAVEARKARSQRLLGRQFTVSVRRGKTVVGQLKALVPASQVVRRILGRTPRSEGQIPFALDGQGELYVDKSGDRGRLAAIGISGAGAPAAEAPQRKDWIIAEVKDPQSDLTFGIARPVGEPLREMRAAAVRNFGYGLAMILAALMGVFLISSRMTERLETLTDATERLAAGDLDTRVPVTSKSEFGRLAESFNYMAGELRDKQVRLAEEEQRRREQAVEQHLLEAENERKGRELEEARQLQMSLLPRDLPRHPGLDIAVFMKTATEVGGDYYDFFPSASGALTTAIGDAAGHGATAGTMVTVVKGLLTVAAGESDLPRLLGNATRAIKRMELGRMNMALTLLRIEDRRISLSAAGMPPVLHYSPAEQRLEEIELVGMPLGTLADVAYQHWESELAPGDTLLMMTDGFAELLNSDEETMGYPRVSEIFEASVAKEPEEIIADLSSAAEAWTGGVPPHDDITFVVLRSKAI